MQIAKPVFLLIIFFSFGARAEEMRFKDGRTFVLDLGRRLGIAEGIVAELFNDLRESLPKSKAKDNLISGVNGMAKAASRLCGEAGLFESQANLEQLYQQILDRKPTKEELAAGIKGKDGKLSHQANCFVLAMSPEYLSLKRGASK